MEQALLCSCEDWIAEYKIMSLESEPETFTQIEFILDPHEIELIIRQSYRFNECNFPLSISDDLKVFTVLRSVYRVVDGNPACDQLSALLPLSTSPNYESWWLNPGFLDNFRYHYSLRICHNSTYLAFMDSDAFSFPLRFSLAIFRLETSFRHTKPVRLASTGNLDDGDPQTHLSCHFAIENLVFHPTEPRVLFRIGLKVFCWNFADGTSGITHANE